MPLKQSVEGCLDSTVGSLGLPQGSLDKNLDKLEARLVALREAHAKGTLPLLRVPKWRDDIEAARTSLKKLTHGARTLVFFGTGGSSLGGQTLAQLGGWGIPGDDKHGSEERPRTRFYDNLDARTLDLALAGLDLKTARFVVISKSGGTPETLVQIAAALDAGRKAGLETRIPELFLAVTEPAVKGKPNGLRALCQHFSIPVLDHDPNIGGRFSGLTNVGLLPALARGLDVVALREGAQSIIDALLNTRSACDFAPAVGAAVAIGLAGERGVRANVMLPYSDRLSRFAAWYVQLWAESLGKHGEGTTPVAALGPVDQHSQLQLYLDGAPQHFITVIREDCVGRGPRVAPDLAKLAHAEYLAGQAAGDLVAAQQRAIPEALIGAGRPVRTIDLEVLDERSLGALMMHFMLETILAAHLLGVDPFDQPAVESGKVLTRRYLAGAEARHGDTRAPA
ncbi:glucose-6-phosphate isomerase [Methyloceanibacter sp.]|uniref:glucose-6-phosphate isomerase n=1 Tax=Methyloceanibacter sp. TaxID=1965321 RepID=UPI002D433DA2|nr:glucose-6-phosphate isomerase [Methyloceanibacter sp.]HZP10459.1 glucose-6-phosphate isomerase [Methyloceanibacter sp.]